MDNLDVCGHIMGLALDAWAAYQAAGDQAGRDRAFDAGARLERAALATGNPDLLDIMPWNVEAERIRAANKEAASHAAH